MKIKLSNAKMLAVVATLVASAFAGPAVAAVSWYEVHCIKDGEPVKYDTKATSQSEAAEKVENHTAYGRPEQCR